MSFEPKPKGLMPRWYHPRHWAEGGWIVLRVLTERDAVVCRPGKAGFIISTRAWLRLAEAPPLGRSEEAE